MELWIRSTAKTNLIKVRFLTIIEGKEIYDKKCWEYKGYTIANIFNDKYEILGTYNSKERALEVLNKIQKAISTYNTENGNYVYEMPPDDEDKEKESKDEDNE